MSDIFWAAFGGGAAAGVFSLLALLFVEWLRRFLDRPMVKCEFTLGLQLFKNRKSVITVFYNARNPHSKSVTLSGCDLCFKCKEWGTLAAPVESFPYQLDVGKSYVVRIPMQELLTNLKRSGRVPSDLRKIRFHTQAHGLFHSIIAEGYIRQLEKKFEEMNES